MGNLASCGTGCHPADESGAQRQVRDYDFRVVSLYSWGEELANAFSHGLGVVASLVGIAFLLAVALPHGAAAITGVSVFGASLVVLYLSSTLYHSLPGPRAKRVFHALDHSAIYLLIAGTYTPFTLMVLPGAWGWGLLVVIWTLALTGILLKSFGRLKHPVLSNGLYLLMGWLVVVAIKPLLEHLPTTGLLWLVAGGVLYTLGVPFYASKRTPWAHFVWHLFVLGGTTCHYFAVLFYAA